MQERVRVPMPLLHGAVSIPVRAVPVAVLLTSQVVVVRAHLPVVRELQEVAVPEARRIAGVARPLLPARILAKAPVRLITRTLLPVVIRLLRAAVRVVAILPVVAVVHPVLPVVAVAHLVLLAVVVEDKQGVSIEFNKE